MEKRRENRRGNLSVMPLLFNRAISIALAAILVITLGGHFDRASAVQPNAESEIQKLAVCYAHGTDAIGRGNLQEGKNIYRDCFTQDATITAIFPDGGSETRIGTDAWADFVYAVFQGNGYQLTQHLIGTIDISVQDTQATMSCYLHATHKRSDTSIDVANGTYEDRVVNENGHWKINHRTLKLIDFLNLSSPTTLTKPNIPRSRQ